MFIANLKFYRKQKGIRQLDLALGIGKSSNYINSIENGKYFPSPETIEEIAAVLGIAPILLFDENGTKKTGTEQKVITEELSETLYLRLKSDLRAFIKEDIAAVLG